jgi:UDP-glucuronate 4-epimerase
MRVLVTGAAGFIGSHLCKRLAQDGHFVVGVDDFSNHPELSKLRMSDLGFRDVLPIIAQQSNFFSNLKMQRCNIVFDSSFFDLFKRYEFDTVIHLAAKAGVRNSIEKPLHYHETNSEGFLIVLEAVRRNKIKNFLYASSSSVYGKQKNHHSNRIAEHFNSNNPLSLYAAQKKANEVTAAAYSNLFGIKCTGMRFFTVYGPWGRPDMVIYKWVKNILKNEICYLYNYGKMSRNFTYIDDVVNAITALIERENGELNEIYNIGNTESYSIEGVLYLIEGLLDMDANIEKLGMQLGDCESVCGTSRKLNIHTGWKTQTDLKEGLEKFIDWFKKYQNELMSI